MVSMKVFGTRFDSLPPEQLDCVWTWCMQLRQQPPRHQVDAQYPECPCWYSAGKVPPKPRGFVVVVVVVVVVGAYSAVTGNRARQLHGSTPRDEVGPMNPIVSDSGPPSCCSRHGGRRKSLWFRRRSPRR